MIKKVGFYLFSTVVLAVFVPAAGIHFILNEEEQNHGQNARGNKSRS